MKKKINQFDLFPPAGETGIIHTIPLLLIIAVVGVISFLLISSTAPIGGLFGIINPKPQSHAAGPVGVWQQVAVFNNAPGAYGTRDVVNDKNRPSDFYAVAQNGSPYLTKSTDFGQTWTQITPQSGAGALNTLFGMSILPSVGSGPATLLIGAGSGFWKSVDGGLNWTNIPIVSGATGVYGPVVDPYDRNHLLMPAHEAAAVYQSTNAGQTWTSVNIAGGMVSSGTPFVFYINTGSAGTTRNTWLYTNQDSNGTWRTTDGGATWTKVSTCTHDHGADQIYQPDTSGVLYMSGPFCTVQRSTDYGVTWAAMWPQNSGPLVNGLTVVFGTPNKVYAEKSGASGCCGPNGPSLATASQPGTAGLWAATTTPAGMFQGAGSTATAFDGSNWIIVTANWAAGIWRYVEPASGVTPPPPPPTSTPTPASMTYNTSFPLTENPISEGGNWLSGKRDGLDWADTRTTPGKAFGTQTGSNPLTYDDSVAILTGTFGTNQEASATVFNNRPAGDYNSEVELHLRSGISGHSVTGYEFEYSTRADNGYCDIVRWNGAWNGGQFWTPLVHGSGGCGVKTGDVVRATAIGNVLTAYINGVQVLQATDNTFTTGNPGVGYYLRNISQTGNSSDWGFTNFTAQTIGTSTPTPTSAPTPTPTPTSTPIPVGEAPFNGPHNLPGTLQLEDYDTGGEGLAYHDTESANNGGAYRTTEGVDVQATTDTGGGFNVGWTLAGEWMKYMVNVTNSGIYNLNFRVASQGAGGTFHLEIDGVNVTGTMTVPDTGNKQTFTTITKPNINLTPGAHTLRMFIESIGAMGGAANFNYLTITQTSTPTPAPTPTGKVGDLDNDGDVDIFDYSSLVSNFGRTGANILGDIDRDGDVDIFDYSLLVSNFGK